MGVECNSTSMISRAERYARELHEGQYRYGSGLPYVVHPENVVTILKNLGVRDETTLSIAWMHDLVEDTNLRCEDILWEFGWEVAYGVYLLTRNVDRERYDERLLDGPANVRLVKLCDALHNSRTLSALSPERIQRKVRDVKNFYIPLAEKEEPLIAEELKELMKKFDVELEKVC